MQSQLVIFTSADGSTHIEVQFEGETFWLSQEQISQLFERDRSVVTKHLRKIFAEGELDEEVVCANFAHTTKHGAIKGKTQQKWIKYYNLDAIISIGYRVNSKRGTQFRQWATNKLKDYLLEGVLINEKRLEQKNKELQILHDGIRILSRAIEKKAHDSEDFVWLYQYSLGLQLLDDYDHELLDVKGKNNQEALYPTMSEYRGLIEKMSAEFNSVIFGREKDGGFDSAVNQIKHGVENQDIYPSIEEKAATLLYLVVKNHAFVDENKRIGAACFLLFLQRNGLLFTASGKTIISNDALASLTLFVAASKAEEMNSVKKLLISVLNRSLE